MNNIQNIISSNVLQESDNAAKKSLDKDDFLTLMITQMQYQDPLKPIDNTEFTSQMAQFSSLEQMTNISKAITEGNEKNTIMNATSLIGKLVTSAKTNENTGDTEAFEGIIKSILSTSEGPLLIFEDQSLPSITMDNVLKIENNAIN